MNIIKDFLNSKKQRVVLNSQFSLSAVLMQEYLSQRSILGPSFFFIYISYLSIGLSSNPKLVADDTFLLIIIPNIKFPEIASFVFQTQTHPVEITSRVATYKKYYIKECSQIHLSCM